MKKIKVPLGADLIKELKIRDRVLLSGSLFTARDQAHKRLTDILQKNRILPFDLKNQVIYYCGPTLTPKGYIIGSCGPTTSSRMDGYTPMFLNFGLKGMVGKGGRNKEVIDAIKKYKAVYFITYAGCGALLAQFVKKKKRVAFLDLGPEAIYRLEVENFPLIVAVDSQGRSIYS